MYRNGIKRLLAVVLSLCGMICLSWLFLILAVAIKLDSPGPVFFKQKRVGIGKKHFYILKFRTMRIDTPHDMPTHLLHDPDQYITRMGHFLRKTSLDELPQLWNILVGDMAVIGPRPGDILLRVVEQMGGHVVGGVDAHGAEFQDVEIALMDAHPLLLEEHRPRRVQLDGKAEQKQQRRQHQQPAGRQHHVQQPLDSFLIHDGSPFYS